MQRSKYVTAFIEVVYEYLDIISISKEKQSRDKQSMNAKNGGRYEDKDPCTDCSNSNWNSDSLVQTPCWISKLSSSSNFCCCCTD